MTLSRIGDPPLGIVCGDMRVVLGDYPDNFFHCGVCDPPYGLEFMGKEWDKLGDVKKANRGTQPDRKRPSWESGSSAKFLLPSPAFDLSPEASRAMQSWHMAWAIEAFRVLRPGAHLVAFGGTRTHHRLMCALEDAGFEIRDTLMWVYGSGFPKSMDIGKSIDKQAGAAREVVGVKPGHEDFIARDKQVLISGMASMRQGFHRPWMEKEDRVLAYHTATAPATSEAQEWDGWGTALKPAWEPIILCRKPLSEPTVAANVLKWGTGAINVDGTRIQGVMDGVWGTSNAAVNKDRVFNASPEMGEYRSAPHRAGRWPANLILQHSDACVPKGTIRIVPKEGHRPNPVAQQSDGRVQFNRKEPGFQKTSYTDTDGAEEVQAWDCVPDCPVAIMDGQSGELTSGTATVKNSTTGYMGSWPGQQSPQISHPGSGGASRFFYQAKADPGERYFLCAACDVVDNVREAHKAHWDQVTFHPTQKPIEVMRWLCRLVAPRGGIVLDPFVGSGTTVVAAEAEGCKALGIDQDAAYCRIAVHRQRVGVPKNTVKSGIDPPKPVPGQPVKRPGKLF